MSSPSHAWQELEADAIQILTRAAHEMTRATDAQDFAAFLVRVLTSTAANVGGPQRLHTGKCDTPAAGHLRALLRGTASSHLETWLPHRTHPVLITLNVAEIVEGGLHPELSSLAAAIDKIVNHTLEGSITTSAAPQIIEAITARYRDEYRSYASRFTLAAKAAGIHHGLRAGVHVAADTNPSSDWHSQTALTNPREGVGDQAAYALWKLAHDSVRLPHVAVADLMAPVQRVLNCTADHANGRSPTLSLVGSLARRIEVES